MFLVFSTSVRLAVTAEHLGDPSLDLAQGDLEPRLLAFP